MRVLVVGASGAIGTRLVPQLIARGHEVIGTYRTPTHIQRVGALGAEPIALDLLDAHAVRKAVLDTEPDAIVNQSTALSDVRFSRNLDRSFAQTNRLRREGTDALLAAAREAGVGGSSRRATPARGTRARAGGSRPRRIRSTPTPCRACARPKPPCGISTRRSPVPAGSRFATAVSTAPPTTGWSSRCASDSSRSWATEAASPPSSTSTTPRPRPCSRSSTTARRSTTSSMTSPLRARVAARSRGRARSQAATTFPGLARAAVRGRDRRHARNHGPRRLQRQGQVRARLDAALPELAAGLRRGVREADCGAGNAQGNPV